VTAYDRIGFEPPILSFGVLEAEEPREKEVLLVQHYRQEEQPSAVQLKTSSARLSVVAGTPRQIDLPQGVIRQETPLRVRLAPQAAGTNGMEQLLACITDAPTATLPIPWTVRARFFVFPQRIFWNLDQESGPEERILRIQRADGQAFCIRRIHTPAHLLTCQRLTTGARTEHRVLLQLLQQPQNRILQGDLTIEVEDRLQPILHIPVTLFRRR
jgi:hypothetical protein